MQPLQRLYDSDGREVCLFPLEYLYLTTARDPAEHDGLSMDFFGWNSLGRVYDCPCYAPFSGEVVYTGNDHNMIYWSSSPVRFVDGTVDYASVLVAHSNTAPSPVGTTFVQGQLWYHTGNYGQSTGDHLHLDIAKGHVTWDTVDWNHLQNDQHIYDMMAMNGTTVVRGMNYNWRDYQGGGPTPPTPPDDEEEKKFPWAIYTHIFRNRANV